jgi:hypothetical protein
MDDIKIKEYLAQLEFTIASMQRLNGMMLKATDGGMRSIAMAMWNDREMRLRSLVHALTGAN